MTTENIEITVARLDERFKGFQTAFTEMATDQRRMAESYEELVKSNQRISLVESDLVALKESTKTLWAKHDAHVAAANNFTANALFRIIELIIAGVGSVVLAKYGVHLL